MPNQENQQFVTKQPQVGDTFIFRGIKLIADRTRFGMCTGCVGEAFRDSCTILPSCTGIVWKKAADQRINKEE